MPGTGQVVTMPAKKGPNGRGWFVLVAGWPGTPARSLGLGPVVAVDTSGPVDVSGLAATLAQVLATD